MYAVRKRHFLLSESSFHFRNFFHRLYRFFSFFRDEHTLISFQQHCCDCYIVMQLGASLLLLLLFIINVLLAKFSLLFHVLYQNAIPGSVIYLRMGSRCIDERVIQMSQVDPTKLYIENKRKVL